MSKQHAANTILNADKVLIFSHVDPDGDAIGSALGLMWALRSIGKHANVSFADPVPVRLRFLPGSEEVVPRPPADDELIVVLDASDPDRVGGPLPAEAMQGREVVNIDHHVTNVNYGTVNWVDPSYPAVAQMIYHLLPLLGIERPDANTATCLLTGMVTDTNAFSTSHTTPAVLRDAADLMEAGAPLPTIMQEAIRSRTLQEVRLWGQVLYDFAVEDGIAWAINTREKQAKAQASENDAGGMSNFLLNIRGVKVAITFNELEDGRTKISMRAKPGHNLADLAFRLGGGGHPLAAGATLDMPIEEAVRTVIPMLHEVIREAETTASATGAAASA